MTYRKNKSQKNKISSEFAARLNILEPKQKVRAIVLLRAQNAGKLTAQRQSRAERQAAIEAMRKSAKQALGDVDDILERFGGQRLAQIPDALGSIPVETTVAGINALAASEWVKAIIEDQAIHPIFMNFDCQVR